MNIGNHNPDTVNILIAEIERSVNKKAFIEYLPMQPGDIRETFTKMTVFMRYGNSNLRQTLGLESACSETGF
jgi:hypothetical protein